MKKLPAVLMRAMQDTYAAARVPPDEINDYAKWLRHYLEFCAVFRHPPRDRDSLMPFLQKLAATHRSVAHQQQAAESVGLYYETVKNWPAGARGHDPWIDVFTRLKEEIRIRQYSPKTLATYRSWILGFKTFVGETKPDEVTSEHAKKYLTHLVVNQQVVASTQSQAFNALLFLYRHILKKPYEIDDSVPRARRTRYIPVVMSREEVEQVIRVLSPPYDLAVSLMYGCGLRLFELLNLRIGCLDFDERVLTVHDGKGQKDRTLPLPEKLIPALRAHIETLEALHRCDLADSYHGVFMPGALDRKWKHASKEWVWQWLFPAHNLTFVPGTSEHRRFHLHESVFGRHLRDAVREARIPKRVTAHTFRHSFASHLLRNNYDIRTIQEMLGHSNVRTTMIYTHTVQSRTLKERKSPLDF